jgi:Bacterial protein of unknown function (DUF885)
MHIRTAFLSLLLCASAAFAQVSPATKPPSPGAPQAAAASGEAPGDKAWIAQSNHYTQMLLDIDKKYSPEQESAEGLSEYDEQIAVPTLANELAERKDREAVLAKLQSAESSEANKYVAEDLAILIKSTQHDFREQDYQLQREVPFLDASRYVFRGIQALLDDQTAPERRQAAVVRLKKYAGLAPGYQPITSILEERVTQQMAKPDVVYPSKQRMEVDLSRDAAIVDGIAELFCKYKLTGWEQPYATLKTQLTAYDAWTTKTVLPKARADFRLPPEEYALALEGYGIDIPPAQVAAMAHQSFADIQQ